MQQQRGGSNNGDYVDGSTSGTSWISVLQGFKVEHAWAYEKTTTAKEYISPRSDEAEPKTPEEWEPPRDLPPCYEKLKEENGIEEDKPPVQCPCFINEKDPTGTFRHHAALLPA